MPTLVDLLRFGPPGVRREAAWAVGNALAGGLRDQVCETATQPCIRAMCDLLSAPDPEMVGLALHALQNALSVNGRGSHDGDGRGGYDDPDDYEDDNDDEFWLYARWIERAGGLAKLVRLRDHESMMVAEKAMCLLHLLVDVPPEGLAELEDLLDEEDAHGEEEEEGGISEDDGRWVESGDEEQGLVAGPSRSDVAGNAGRAPVMNPKVVCKRTGSELRA